MPELFKRAGVALVVPVAIGGGVAAGHLAGDYFTKLVPQIPCSDATLLEAAGAIGLFSCVVMLAALVLKDGFVGLVSLFRYVAHGSTAIDWTKESVGLFVGVAAFVALGALSTFVAGIMAAECEECASQFEACRNLEAGPAMCVMHTSCSAESWTV